MRRTHMTKVESFFAVRYNVRLSLRLQDLLSPLNSSQPLVYDICCEYWDIPVLVSYFTAKRNLHQVLILTGYIYSWRRLTTHWKIDPVTRREYDIFYPRLRKTTPKSKSQQAKPPLQKQADSKAPNAKDDEAIQIEALRKGKQNRAAVLAKSQAIIDRGIFKLQRHLN